MDTFLSLIRQKIAPYQKVMVAFSGGVDSTVLLHLLVCLRNQQESNLNVRACYIHHGLSQNAQYWAEHCQKVCQDWHVPLLVKHVHLADKNANIEAQAREARYEALSDVLQPQELLVTAQHLDDQCETFLLALKRGSGPAGLSGIASRIAFAETEIVRPLLSISRQQIETYARENNLIWIEDESNQQTIYDRNFLRLAIIPSLTQRWPHFAEMVNRSAQLCAEQEALLDELLQPILEQLIDNEGCLLIDPILAYSDSKRSAILRRWLAFHCIAMPSREQLKLIWQQVALAKLDAMPKYQLGSYFIHRFKGKLYIEPSREDLTNIQISWSNFRECCQLPDNLGEISYSKSQEWKNNEVRVRAPQEDECITIRFTAQGEFTIVGRRHRRSIKKLWQEFDIPPWQRHRIPLIYYNDQLIAAMGVFVTQEGADFLHEEGISFIWKKSAD